MITYNHEKYIAQALDSILMQEVDFKYEIVVGEDCSTDDTRQILLVYKKKYPDKFKLLLHDENIGMMNNILSTLKNCSGKYIAMLEGDDYWIDSEKLQIQIGLMEDNPNCHMSFHPAEIRIDNDESGTVYGRHTDKNKIFTTSEIILGGGDFCTSSSVVYHREVVSKLPEFFVNAPVPDYIIQTIGSLNGGALYFDKVMSVYRQGIDGSWSSNMRDIEKREKWAHDSFVALDNLNIYLDKKYQNEIRQRISNLHYKMSTFYLDNNMYKKFKMNIESSFNLCKFDSSIYLLNYYFRSFPKLLSFLKKIKHYS